MTGDPSRAERAGPGFLWWILRAQWACGPALLLAHTETSRPALLVTAAAFAAGAAQDIRRPRRPAWRSATPLLLILTVAASAADFLFGSGEILPSLSVLVLGIQSLRLLLPKTARDGWQLCAISFLEFLAAAASTGEIRFAAFAFLFLGLSAGAMWALQAEAQTEEWGEDASRRVPRGFAVRLIVFSAPCGFLLAAVLFLVIPRVGVGQFMPGAAQRGGVTGFSDVITLRDVTGVKADRRVAARVEFPTLAEGLSPPPLYLRGATFATFDGSRWTRGEQAWLRVPRSGFIYIVGQPERGASLSSADIVLETMDNPAVFVYGTPTMIEGTLGDLRTDGHGNISFPEPGHPPVRYRLQFASGGSARQWRGAAPSHRHLALPPGWEDVREMGRRVTAGAATDGERAQRAVSFLASGFRYTIDDPAPTLRDFLFSKRAGFCEHFASALCLMLRASGVPARVAAGYFGGEWSAVGGYLIVRQSDAHAWTEAWIDGRWVTLDATPPPGEGSPFLVRTGTAGIYLDWIRQRWNKYVVNYSLRMQADAVSGGWSAFRVARTRAWKAAEGIGADGIRRALPALLPAAVLLSALLVALYRKADRNRVSLPGAYGRLLRRLSRLGYRRSPGTTMEAMLRFAVSRSPAILADALRFLDLYHRDRFGPFPLSGREGREASRLASRLAKELPRA